MLYFSQEGPTKVKTKKEKEKFRDVSLSNILQFTFQMKQFWTTEKCIKEIFVDIFMSLRETETIESEIGWTLDKTLYGDLWVDLFPLLASWGFMGKDVFERVTQFSTHNVRAYQTNNASDPGWTVSLGRAWQPVGETRRQRYELCNCMLSRHPFFGLHYSFDEWFRIEDFFKKGRRQSFLVFLHFFICGLELKI